MLKSLMHAHWLNFYADVAKHTKSQSPKISGTGATIRVGLSAMGMERNACGFAYSTSNSNVYFVSHA